jgi:hypothetical protein
MTIQTIVMGSLILGLDRFGSAAAPGPVPVYDLVMAAVAIVLWAAAVGAVSLWLRARERNAARAHIRSMLIVRRAPSAPSDQTEIGHRSGLRDSWLKPAL